MAKWYEILWNVHSCSSTLFCLVLDRLQNVCHDDDDEEVAAVFSVYLTLTLGRCKARVEGHLTFTCEHDAVFITDFLCFTFIPFLFVWFGNIKLNIVNNQLSFEFRIFLFMLQNSFLSPSFITFTTFLSSSVAELSSFYESYRRFL